MLRLVFPTSWFWRISSRLTSVRSGTDRGGGGVATTVETGKGTFIWRLHLGQATMTPAWAGEPVRVIWQPGQEKRIMAIPRFGWPWPNKYQVRLKPPTAKGTPNLQLCIFLVSGIFLSRSLWVRSLNRFARTMNNRAKQVSGTSPFPWFQEPSARC